jgi:purine-nucleoside phosphorylase
MIESRIEESLAIVTRRVQDTRLLAPCVGIVLGSGFGAFADTVEDRIGIPYQDIPYLASSTAPGHQGMLVFGTVKDVPIMCFQGRVHSYEGYSAAQIAYPIQLLASLHPHACILTNASGGIREDLTPGTIMAMDDHINLLGANPLTGSGNEGNTRFIDMSHAYAPWLLTLADEVACAQGFVLKHGIYLATPGPSFETPAEIRAFRTMGADAVGMSTVIESIAAVAAGMPLLGISLIANRAAGLGTEELTPQDVLAMSNAAAPRMQRLLTALVARLSDVSATGA